VANTIIPEQKELRTLV